MKQARRSPRAYFEDLLECCERIQTYVGKMSLDEFQRDRLRQDAVVRNFEILGEASSQLIETLPNAAIRFPAIPFADMYVTRNRIIHGYSTTKPHIIYEAAIRDVPVVRAAVEQALTNWPADLT